MKILVLIRWPVGGIQTYCRYVYGLSVFAQCRFTVVTTTDADEGYLRGAFGATLSDLVCLPAGEFSAARILHIARRAAPPSLIHAHGFSSAILGVPAKLLLGVPLLVTSHDILQDSQFVGPAGFLKKLSLAAALLLSTRVNVVGRDAGDNLRAYFPRICSAAKLVTIPNGIDTERFSEPRRRDLRGELGVAGDVVLLGFFGRFMAQKGFRYILEMLEGNSQPLEAPIHVACFGWGGFIREEQAAIAERGLTRYFSFLPATDDMPATLRGCDAVLMPSLWEAMPLLAMEVMVAGVPLIASTCIGLREVCAGSPALMCAPRDGRSLLDAVNRLSLERPRREAEAGAYRAEARRRFDRAQAGAQLWSLYRDLAPPA